MNTMSDCEMLLERFCQQFQCKAWVCEKVGRRMSYLAPLKAGEERYCEPMVLFEDDRFVLFVQCDQINEEMKSWGWKVVDCVRRHFDDNYQPS